MLQIDESTELQGIQLMRIYKKELLPFVKMWSILHVVVYARGGNHQSATGQVGESAQGSWP